jgi:threonine dehydratase
VTAVVDRAAVEAAAAGLEGHVRRTPVLAVGAGDLGDGTPGLLLKLELLQRSGSFKARGAHWQLLRRIDEARAAGVVAASGGNFGIAVADAARSLGVGATIFVASLTTPAKIDRLRLLGADVVVTDGSYADAYTASVDRAAATGAVAVHAYDAEDMIAGNGTMAAELDGAVPPFDTAVVAVGGGGLLAGCLAWWGDEVRVVAVESEGTPTLHAALAAGEPVDVDVTGTSADSLGARRVGALAWELVGRHRPMSLLVTDEDVLDAQRRLWAACRLYAEPGGAAALAALTSGRYVPAAGERVAVVVCGANGDPSTL